MPPIADNMKQRNINIDNYDNNNYTDTPIVTKILCLILLPILIVEIIVLCGCGGKKTKKKSAEAESVRSRKSGSSLVFSPKVLCAKCKAQIAQHEARTAAPGGDNAESPEFDTTSKSSVEVVKKKSRRLPPTRITKSDRRLVDVPRFTLADIPDSPPDTTSTPKERKKDRKRKSMALNVQIKQQQQEQQLLQQKQQQKRLQAQQPPQHQKQQQPDLRHQKSPQQKGAKIHWGAQKKGSKQCAHVARAKDEPDLIETQIQIKETSSSSPTRKRRSGSKSRAAKKDAKKVDRYCHLEKVIPQHISPTAKNVPAQAYWTFDEVPEHPLEPSAAKKLPQRLKKTSPTDESSKDTPVYTPQLELVSIKKTKEPKFLKKSPLKLVKKTPQIHKNERTRGISTDVDHDHPTKKH